MILRTNRFQKSYIIGDTAARPPAATMKVGDEFYDRQTGVVSVITEMGNVKSWQVFHPTEFVIDASGAYPNSFTTWLAFWNAYNSAAGPAQVFVIGTVPVPAGTYDLRLFTTIGAHPNVTQDHVLQLQDGALIENLFTIGLGITIESVSSSPCLAITVHPAPVIFLGETSHLKASGTSPMILWTDGPTNPLVLAMQLGSSTINNGSPVVRLQGVPLTPATAIFFVDGHAELLNDTVSGNVDSNVFLDCGSVATVVEAQPNYLGGPPNVFADAELDAGVALNMQGKDIDNQRIHGFGMASTIPPAYPYTTALGDTIVDVDTSAPRSVILNSTLDVGTVHCIRDATGGAPGDPITITATAGAVLGPAGSGTINSARGYQWFRFDGTNWVECGRS